MESCCRCECVLLIVVEIENIDLIFKVDISTLWGGKAMGKDSCHNRKSVDKIKNCFVKKQS